jgi:flagellar protein FlaG
MVTATKPAAKADPQRSSAGPAVSSAPLVKAASAEDATRDVKQTTAAIAAQIESYLRSVGRSVQLSIDSSSGRTVISVRDAATGDLIRQIPSEEALRLSRAIGEQINSLVDVLV